MTISFPSNPSLNDTYTYQSSIYTWDGEKWVSSGASLTTDTLVEGTTNLYMDSAQESKLAGIEAGAQVNPTNVSAFTNDAGYVTGSIDSHTDVDTTTVAPTSGQALIWNSTDGEWQPGSGGAMSDAEVKTAYENNADTNAFTDAEQTKLAGIATGAEVNPTVVSAFTNDSGYLTDITGENIGDLTDVVFTSATNGDVLSYNGSNWVNTSAPPADISGSSVGQLSDVTITAAATGEVLRYSGSAWVDAQLDYSDLSGTPTLGTAAATASTDYATAAQGTTADSAIQPGEVNPVLFSNQAAFPSAASNHGAIAHSHADGAMYFAHNSVWNKLANDSDLSNYATTASLGTAATTDSTAYATAAQGTTADSALQPTSSIDDLSDVDTTTAAPTDGQVLAWDNGAQKWEPATVSGGGSSNADTLDNQDGLYYLDYNNFSNTPTIGDGNIRFNAGNGLSETGSNATANQSANTTKTFSVQAADSTIDVGVGGISVNISSLGIPLVGNGGINFNAGNGLSETGTNATANQTGSTTKTFSVQASDSTITVGAGGISVNTSAIGTDLGNTASTTSVSVTSSTGSNTTISAATTLSAGVMSTTQVSNLNTALSNASAALSDAATAQSTADTAVSDAAAAQSTATTANNNATSALSALYPKTGGTMTGDVTMGTGAQYILFDAADPCGIVGNNNQKIGMYTTEATESQSFKVGYQGGYLDHNGNGVPGISYGGGDRIGMGWTSPNVNFHINTGSAGYVALTASDVRLKENITPISTGAIDTINSLNPVSFSWIDGTFHYTAEDLSSSDPEDRKRYGFIANEVIATIPQANRTPSATESNPEPIKDYDERALLAFLTKAVQELSAQNEELKNRIEALEG
jgi:hypothetical protein